MRSLEGPLPAEAVPEVRGMLRRWTFWIVGGGATGLGLVGFGLFLAYHRFQEGPAAVEWVARLAPFWGAPLGFGVVVLVHALDVARDRRTLLRLLDRGEGSPRLPVPGARDRQEPSRERE
ncbi:MAG: hypothetical protein N2320_05370 [Candidatus Bipolaricaulota bacterium]|nr:hypothetical protein [Candidatus Bipolaricaulota bacterium]